MEHSQTWSTRDVEPSQVSAFWSTTITKIMPGLMFDPLQDHFEASVKQWTSGGLRLSLVQAQPQRITVRGGRQRTPSSKFALIYLKSGLLRVQQSARITELTPGECVLLDGGDPSEVITCSPSESLSIAIPAGWLRQWLARPEDEVAKSFNATSSLTRPLVSVLDLLAEGDETGFDQGADLISNQLGGAIAIAVGSKEIVGTDHSTRLLNRLKQGICAHFYDQDYCPQSAADEAGISRRYLVSLFAASGTTFNTELMRVRLEKSAQFLRDRRFEALSIMDISLRCGFSDASHFSKRFRAKFGMSPAIYRQTFLARDVYVSDLH